MRELKEKIYCVGANDWDARLFDGLIPLPDGTSYNSYVVVGSEKTALVDTVDVRKTDELLGNLADAGIERVDYIVAHHAEQDHSGSIREVLLLHPEAKVVCSEKCRGMLIDHLELDEDVFLVVGDGETLSLGGRTLTFLHTPWVHWPETICTYLQEDKILFSCDFFGSHMATSELCVTDKSEIYEPAKRYYAEIMSPFRNVIRKNLQKLEPYDIETIAPSHGPVYRDPGFIVDCYEDWTSEAVKNAVVLPYVSMHHSTQMMVDHLTRALIERGIDVYPFNMAVADLGKLAMVLIEAATLIVGSGQILAGLHPLAAHACFVANALRPKTKFAGLIGSYGWGGRMKEQVGELTPNIKAEMFEPVLSKGVPKENEYRALDDLAEKILQKHRELGII